MVAFSSQITPKMNDSSGVNYINKKNFSTQYRVAQRKKKKHLLKHFQVKNRGCHLTAPLLPNSF